MAYLHAAIASSDSERVFPNGKAPMGRQSSRFAAMRVRVANGAPPRPAGRRTAVAPLRLAKGRGRARQVLALDPAHRNLAQGTRPLRYAALAFALCAEGPSMNARFRDHRGCDQVVLVS